MFKVQGSRFLPFAVLCSLCCLLFNSSSPAAELFEKPCPGPDCGALSRSSLIEVNCSGADAQGPYELCFAHFICTKCKRAFQESFTRRLVKTSMRAVPSKTQNSKLKTAFPLPPAPDHLPDVGKVIVLKSPKAMSQ